MIDTLTKLESFTAFNEKLPTCKHPKVFIIDIKNFKRINLIHGDEGGDFILNVFAGTLLGFAKEYEIELFRFKNDQFIFLLDVPFDLNKMEKIIFALSDMLKHQRYAYRDQSIAFEVHIGICFDLTHPLEKAQKALFVAKAENQLFVTYSEFANTLMGENEEKIEAMVKEAIEKEQIVLHFQAVVDRDTKIVYHESFIRLNSSEELQSPKLFLKIARKKNFYDLILDKITEKIIATAQKNNLLLAINLSSFDLLDEKRVAFLCERFAGHKIIFEIQCDDKTHLPIIAKIARQFKQMGGLIALDNVDSIDTIKAFGENEIDFVKVHGDIVRNLAIDPSALLTCKAILKMSKELGAQSIATYINAKTALTIVQNLPFDLFQGYIFEQPHTL